MVEKIVKSGKELKEKLSLQTHPLGIKFCKSKEEADGTGLRRFSERFGDAKVPICQAINISRTYGTPFLLGSENSFCIIGAISMGLLDEIPDYFEELIHPWHAKSKEAAEKIKENLKSRFLPLKSTYALAISPLERLKFDPDVLVIYGTPTQISKIAKAFAWHGIIPKLSFLGLAACSSISNSHITREPVIGIPCAGELVFGRTEETEISIAFPAEKIDELMDGLEGTRRILPYPVPKYLLYEPRILLEGYKISYKDYLEWKERRK